jgi:myosin-15
MVSCSVLPFPHRVFGSSWDSDEDTPTRPQPQGHIHKMPDSDGYCSHNEADTNGETEAQRGTATHQGQPAMASVSGGNGA